MSGSVSVSSVLGRVSEIEQTLGVAGGTTPTAAGAQNAGGASFASVLADATADVVASSPVQPTSAAAPHSTAKATTTFQLAPGMTAQQRAAVYVSRLTHAKAHGGLTAFQRAELAKYSAMVAVHPSAAKPATSEAASAAARISSPATSSATPSVAGPSSAPAPEVAPGTLSQIDGKTYVNLGSYTNSSGDYVPGGQWIDLSSPSTDTYGLLQQLFAVQADPSLLQGSPLASYGMFSDPMQRASEIAQLGGSILASGPAYYGAYSGLSGAQIQQIAKAAQTAAGINLNPAIAAAIDRAAAVTPADAPATAPLTAASIAQAVANVSTISVGSYGSLSVSSLPAGTAPQYAGSPAPAATDGSSAATTPSGGSS